MHFLLHTAIKKCVCRAHKHTSLLFCSAISGAQICFNVLLDNSRNPVIARHNRRMITVIFGCFIEIR